jgi:hypothetical protein
MRWISLLTLLVACGQENTIISRRAPEPPPVTLKVDDALLKRYVDEFYQLCVDRNHSTCLDRFKKLESVAFVDATTIQNGEPGAENRAGVCYVWSDQYNRIHKTQIQVLNIEWDPKVLEGLIYHELGHCVLGLDHVQGGKNNPKMMNPYVYYAELYLEYWQQMVDELFTTALSLLGSKVENDNSSSTTSLTKRVYE